MDHDLTKLCIRRNCMTRNRTLLTLLAGLVFLIATPAFAVTPEPVQVFQYPAPYPIQAHFPDEDPIEIPKPIPPGPVRGVEQTPDGSSNETASKGPALGGSSIGASPILGASLDTGMGKPDTEGLVRTARRELDG
jgi:hypothetical protein